ASGQGSGGRPSGGQSPAQALRGHGRNVSIPLLGSRLLSPAGGSTSISPPNSSWIHPQGTETRRHGRHLRQHGRHFPLRLTPATAPASSRARALAPVRTRAARTSARRSRRPSPSASDATAGWPGTPTG